MTWAALKYSSPKAWELTGLKLTGYTILNFKTKNAKNKNFFPKEIININMEIINYSTCIFFQIAVITNS